MRVSFGSCHGHTGDHKRRTPQWLRKLQRYVNIHRESEKICRLYVTFSQRSQIIEEKGSAHCLVGLDDPTPNDKVPRIAQGLQYVLFLLFY
uniref:Uncharacterized protein n=1 Tax=Oryzias latipes TaxID=8090 RepID=A0A3P9M6L2_ORYLA